MCFEDDEGLVKNEQLFESYLEPALLPAPLTLKGVSVCTWNWGNTIDGKTIFPLSHMTLDQMQLECSLRWQLLVAESLPKAGSKRKEPGSTLLFHMVFWALRSCLNGMESCWTLGYLG